MDVKNSMFVANEHFVCSFLLTMRKEKKEIEKDKSTEIKITTENISLKKTEDILKLIKALDLTDVIFMHSKHLFLHDLTSLEPIVMKKEFKSFRSDNKIKIKNVPQSVSFENVDVDQKEKLLLKKYREKLLEQIQIVTGFVDKISNKFMEKEYFEILRKLCAYSFDPSVCAKEGNISNLKLTFDLIYSLMQTYCKYEYIRDNTPLFPFEHIWDVDFVSEWLPILRYYVENHKNIEDVQKTAYKSTWEVLTKFLTRNFKDVVFEVKKKDKNEQYGNFFKLLKQIDVFVPDMNDLEVFMESADKVIKDDKADLVKITESYDKGVELEKRMGPYNECFTSIFDVKHKNFKQMISELGKKCGKVDEADKDKTEKDKDKQLDKDKTEEDKDKKDEKDKTEEDKDKRDKKDKQADKESKMSATTIAIIIISSLAGVGIIFGIGFYWYLKKKKAVGLQREEIDNQE